MKRLSDGTVNRPTSLPAASHLEAPRSSSSFSTIIPAPDQVVVLSSRDSESLPPTQEGLNLLYQYKICAEKKRYREEVQELLFQSAETTPEEYHDAVIAAEKGRESKLKEIEKQHLDDAMHAELHAWEGSIPQEEATEQPPKKRLKVTRPSVTVIVGQEDNEACEGSYDAEEPIQEFTVDKSILCARSPFFNAAFNGPWLESATKTVSLPEHRPSCFATYVSWLYKEEFTIGLAVGKEDSPSLLELYFFAEAVQDLDFADIVSDALWRARYVTDQWYGANATRYIYDNTAPSSPLRRMHVELMLFEKEHHGEITDGNPPKAFLIDAVKRVTSTRLCKREYIDGRNMGCDYHYHMRNPDQECRNKKDLPKLVFEVIG